MFLSCKVTPATANLNIYAFDLVSTRRNYSSNRASIAAQQGSTGPLKIQGLPTLCVQVCGGLGRFVWATLVLVSRQICVGPKAVRGFGCFPPRGSRVCRGLLININVSYHMLQHSVTKMLDLYWMSLLDKLQSHLG